jgi:uncharacterized repeat protein (TIGR03803 family)
MNVLFARARRMALGWLAACAGALGAWPALAYDVPRINTLYHFVPADYPNLGNFELSPLVQGPDGDFYGVSAYGGAHDAGYVYKVSRTTGQLTHLHDFTFQDGVHPRGRLFLAADGHLYGTTESGGVNQSDFCYAAKFYNASGCGTAFRITLDGTFTKLHDFYTEADGYQASPSTGMVQAGDGNFYGMAVQAFPSGQASLFRMTPSGSVTPLRVFAADGSEGSWAYAGLTVARDGALYGTSGSHGGPGACGVVFRAGLDGSFAKLHVFTGVETGTVGDGCLPRSPLLQGADGAFYGTTQYGGYQAQNCIAGGCGTVYRLTTSGAYRVLHRFTATAADGEYPQDDGLVQLPDGTLIGATGGNPYGDGWGFVPLCQPGGATAFSCGTLYKISPNGSFTQLVVFGDSNGAWGLFPHATLMLASDGNLYGTTFGGGGWGYGTVFRYVLDAATPIVAIDAFSPAGGPVGTSVAINGTGFTGASRLTIGDGTTAMPIAFSVVSDSQITTQIPPAAQSSAFGVTTPRGTTYSPQTFYLAPTVDRITPTSGRVGTPVTVLGSHFENLQSITLGGTPVTRWNYVNATSISLIVPARAKTGPIVLTNAGGSGASQTFTVKRFGGGQDSDAGEALASPALPAVRCDARPAAGALACGAPRQPRPQ